MTQKEIRSDRAEKISQKEYCMHYFRGWNYSILDLIWHGSRKVKKRWVTFSDAIIMCDTETSKEKDNEIIGGKYVAVENYVVAWTIAIRAYGHNIVTLWGKKPTELCECLGLIRDHIKADNMILYWHNMAYDWTFVRKFLIGELGDPDKQLNVKPHYPILIGWENAGIIMKDSLILAQRSLARWAKDLNVEHQKAIGAWDYKKIRTQDPEERFTADELLYIQNDVLAGVECIEKTMQMLEKDLMYLPYTATGIPRGDIQQIASKNKGHSEFNRMQNTYRVHMLLEQFIFHGGFVHANRHLLNVTITPEIVGTLIQCYDFMSDYPYCMLVFKYPMSKFMPLKNCTVQEILKRKDDYCFIFKLIMFRPRLKDYEHPMPALQFSKCVKAVNPILDNGRILGADYVEIYLTEIDLEVINDLYTWDKHICTDVHYAEKGYLPKWFRDYIYALFYDKCALDGVDEVLRTLQKYKINSCYGMCVQKPVKPEVIEDYNTGEYKVMDWDEARMESEYAKYCKKRTSVLPFAWGVYVTAYAYRNIFELGKCCETWIYSDTDSAYGAGWIPEKVNAFNENCKRLLKEAGYGPVIAHDREYWIGTAEHKPGKDDYTEFRVQGAKRYCGRCVNDNELHITVAGVPKCGAKELKDDIEKFHPGFIFKGEATNKMTHTYMYNEEICIHNGNEVGDSIDLTPCDYELDGVIEIPSWEELLHESVDMPTYGEEYIYEKGGGLDELE